MRLENAHWNPKSLTWNHIVRQRVHEGVALPGQITLDDIQDDSYLRPVLDDDALILCLDDLPDVADEAAAKSQEGTPLGDPALVESLRKQNAELQAELDKLAGHFSSYRLAVQQTLDQRWGEDDETAESSNKKSTGSSEKPKDDSSSYFESYAHNGMNNTLFACNFLRNGQSWLISSSGLVLREKTSTRLC